MEHEYVKSRALTFSISSGERSNTLFRYGEFASRPFTYFSIKARRELLISTRRVANLPELGMASKNMQIVVTSHSPDLLDDKSISEENILAVVNKNGETKIGPLDQAGKSAIRDRLYTAGELLRLGQMEPDETLIESVTTNQLELFPDDKI
jgi:hypothetical protein